MTKTKIILAGIGGVGGYFGGKLANHFYGNEHVGIHFIARGEHLREIQNNGLKVIHRTSEFIAIPVTATDNASEIGVADFVIIATKSYDLDAVLEQLKSCVNKDTIILPLLNGVDSKQRIKNVYTDNIVLDGCVYIVSRLKQAGVIENSGNIQSLFFGLDSYKNGRMVLLEKILKEAGIEAKLSNTISTVIWEKFIFLSPIATVTSAYNKCIGEIISDSEIFTILCTLIEEVKKVANANNILISDNIIEKTLNKYKALSFETTTSMHADFKNNKMNTELESLTGFVIHEAQKHNIPTPAYLRLYEMLKIKNKQ